MKALLHVDEAVGETRRCLTDLEGRAFRLDFDRWSERGQRARVDEIWWGRATARTPGAAGWFVDLGLDRAAVLESKKAGAITEGAMVPVRIKAEAWADKGALLSLADMKASAPRPTKPGPQGSSATDAFLLGYDIVESIHGAPAREVIDAAVEDGLAINAALPGGGDIAIEATRAMTAVDVDAGSRTGAGPDFVRDLNLAAADEVARQIALRSIGGLVVVDFVSMAGKDRRGVVAALRTRLKDLLGRSCLVSDLSALGLCEMAIARRARPLVDALGAGAEREGLDAIRMIESCGVAARGDRIQARVSTAAAAWLEADPIGWRDALAGRIGMRWAIEAKIGGPAGRYARPEVWSVR